MDVIEKISEELEVSAHQVSAAIKLLDEGSTVPFIARYRKEVTGGLDDTQLRTLEERLRYLRELNDRRETILESIRSQDKLTEVLEKAILGADSKTELEDLYLPYKPKRRTKAQIAREAGLATLAEGLLSDPAKDPTQLANEFINAEHNIENAEQALDGARQILMEQFAEDAAITGRLRERVQQEGILRSRVAEGMETQGAKFRDYFDYDEKINRIPSHRALAMLRGRNENILTLDLIPEQDEAEGHQRATALLAKHFGISDQGRPADAWLLETCRLAWRIKLFTRIELDLKSELRNAAEEEAISVFASNLRDLLLAAPAGPKATMGLDPGLRTGVKVAVVSATGKLLDTATIYPHPPKKQWDASLATLKKLVETHHVQLISIGNGTASRETDKLAAELLSSFSGASKPVKIMVSEAGASVYSASELAAKEFPELDVSLRGAVSIARRVQDPLSELVKIEPKAIGVGQYQHDVNQNQLARSLDTVVEDCVNAVGVDVNTASVELLRYVSGLNQTAGQNIVAFRDENGPFRNREELLKVPRLGDKTFEQAAGFLRIMAGDNPLDASAVHPEAYPVVEDILKKNTRQITDVIGNPSFLKQLAANDYTSEKFGIPTVTDIISELEKPGRDPRPEFRSADFMEGVDKITDLKPGMKLNGAVTNVTNFGAFVDIGVHQDGLVHISHLSDTFVKDPRTVVRTGDLVKVTVLEVDVERKRISLSMKSGESAAANGSKQQTTKESSGNPRNKPQQQNRKNGKPAGNHTSKPATAPAGAMAAALAKAFNK